MDHRQVLIKYTPPPRPLESPSRAHERSLAQQQLTVVDLWRLLNKRKWTIFGFAGFVFLLAAAYAFLRQPKYEGVARLQIDPTRTTNLGLSDDWERLASPDVEGRIKTEETIIGSDTVALQVMNQLRLYADPRFAGKDAVPSAKDINDLSPAQRRKLLERFQGNLTVKTIPSTQVVEIHFRGPDPALSTQVANSVIDQYLQRNLAARVEGTAQVSQWVSKQMEDIRASTTAAQEQLAGFQKANDMLGTDESDNIVMDRLKQLNEELTQAEADRIVKEGRYRLASSGNAELINSLGPSTTLNALRTQEADLREQAAQLGAKFGSGYPKLRELQDELSKVEQEIAAEGENIKTRIANEYYAAEKAEGMIRGDFDRQKSEAYKLNQNVAQYAILKHEVEAGQQLYDTLQLKLKAAGITSGLTSSFVDVIDRAQVPDTPVGPRKALLLAIGLGGGLFGGLLLGLLQDSFDDAIRTSEELEAATSLPELASVPFLDSFAKRGLKDQSARPLFSVRSQFGPVVFGEARSPGIESYRTLCSAILHPFVRDSMKMIVVTSASPAEGKSAVSRNLATALALRGKKVLLVDADLRCSSMLSQPVLKAGLSTMCAAGAENHPRYQPISALPNLHFVPAGIRPTDPTSILDSPRMQHLLATWRSEYDHIIVDTPPVLPFADALVLSARADGVILVVRSGVTHGKALLRAREVLERSGANILGFVMNAARKREAYYDYPASYQPPVPGSEKDRQPAPPSAGSASTPKLS